MSIPAASRAPSEPVSRVEILVSCNHLLDRDVTSKSDPCCILEMKNKNNYWFEVGRTETIQNCLDPQFAKSIEVDYFFEEVQPLRFTINDVDNRGKDALGFIECTLGEVVSGSPFTRPLKLNSKAVAGRGSITLRAQELGNLRDCLLLQFCAKNLDNKDFMGKSDPYLEFSRRMPDGGYQVVHRTEVVQNTLNPRWRPIEIKATRLCGSDYKSSIKVECSDYDKDGSHDLIGSFETTVEELLQGGSKQLQWPCINPKKKAKKKSYQNSGIVSLESCKVTKVHTFLDFIFGGLQINFTVGIDFTASNGHPNNPSSLHYMHPTAPNSYMRAIMSVGQVIQDYDSDQMFPALGYGAKVPPSLQVSHVFALNFNAANPFCAGIQGILDAYRYCLSQVTLHGPTNFAPIIHHVAQFALTAQKERAAKNYFILLIITDGVISDMADTIRAIIYASSLPFSLIIVGVGNADFSAMDALDGDNGVLRDNSGNVCRRDIVQFVPFSQFENVSPAALAKQVLAEVPDQVVGYYKMSGIEPGVPGTKPPSQGPFQAAASGAPGQHGGGAVPTPFAQASGTGQTGPGQVPTGPGQAPAGPGQGATGTGQPMSGQGLYPAVAGLDQQYRGQAPYPGQQPGGPGQPGGQAPYAGQQPGAPGQYGGGQAPHPGQQPGGPGQPGSGVPGGQGPYPGQQAGGAMQYGGGGQAPYSGQQPGAPGQYGGGQGPYAGQQPGGPAQHGGGQAPYPGQQPGAPGQPGSGVPGGHAPYPGQQPGGPGQYGGGGQGPYPGQQGGGVPGGQAPYPGQQPGAPGQPGGGMPGKGQAPYPPQQPGGPTQHGGGQAPYPGQQPGAPGQYGGQGPYPGQQPGGPTQHGGGQAPYPGQQPGGPGQYGGSQAPYPSQQPGGPGPYHTPTGPGAYVTPGSHSKQ